MLKNRVYRRELSDHERTRILKLYEKHINSKGFLSKKVRERLLGTKKKERETLESDFWYNIKRQSRGALLDLELISYVANDEQLRGIFEPYSKMDHLKLDLLFGARKKEELPKEYAYLDAEYSRTDLQRLAITILTSDRKMTHWKERLAIDLIDVGLDYISQKEEFKGRLYQRLFDDLRDALKTNYYYFPD